MAISLYSVTFKHSVATTFTVKVKAHSANQSIAVATRGMVARYGTKYNFGVMSIATKAY